jgi:hypothetical protein
MSAVLRPWLAVRRRFSGGVSASAPLAKRVYVIDSRDADLFVRNLASDATEADVHKAFAAVCEVRKVRLQVDWKTGASRNTAYVTVDSRDAFEACAALDGSTISGGRVGVEAAPPFHKSPKRKVPDKRGIDHAIKRGQESQLKHDAVRFGDFVEVVPAAPVGFQFWKTPLPDKFAPPPRKPQKPHKTPAPFLPHTFPHVAKPRAAPQTAHTFPHVARPRAAQTALLHEPVLEPSKQKPSNYAIKSQLLSAQSAADVVHVFRVSGTHFTAWHLALSLQKLGFYGKAIDLNSRRDLDRLMHKATLSLSNESDNWDARDLAVAVGAVVRAVAASARI